MNSKASLRKHYLSLRRSADGKYEKNNSVFQKLINTDFFKNADTVITYVSFNDEIDTLCLIDYSLKANKRVAIPYCTSKKGIMKFYCINSLSDLISGMYKIPEPNIEKCSELKDYNGSIIIVPGICFSEKGYRLGYGGGYYDRFLKNYPFISVGLCYNSCIAKSLPVDNNDIKVKYIITETKLIDCNYGGENG